MVSSWMLNLSCCFAWAVKGWVYRERESSSLGGVHIVEMGRNDVNQSTSCLLLPFPSTSGPFLYRNLEVLDLSHNKLRRIPSSLPAPLRHLSVHHNQIESILGLVFSHLRPGLVYLHLAHNKLDEGGLEIAAFQGLEDTLAQLLLDHNRLRSVPSALPRLQALRLLRLDHNLIRWVSA